MDYSMQKRIVQQISKSGKSGMHSRELAKKLKCKPADVKRLNAVLSAMVKQGELVRQGERYKTPRALGLFAAKITRIQRTFGFARRLSDDVEVFIPGRFLKGALPDDLVFVKLLRSQRGESPEGEVSSIISYGPGEFTGVVVYEDGRLKVLPDQFLNTPVELVHGEDTAPGQKVIARVVKRGSRHSEHRAQVIGSYGDAGNAASCAAALLELEGITKEFPAAVLDEARYIQHRGIPERDLVSRLDLRSEPIFTIDGADSKDLDDAVSLICLEDGYQLGVHIADVSHYVRFGSALDKEAFERGTSIYYADQVIPMLPKELSNGICSLNPNEDRLAFSALLSLDLDGNLVDYDFRKSVICSRVKGVYSEVNAIMDGTADERTVEKYRAVLPEIGKMKALAEKLCENRKKRGAPELETTESKILVGEDGVTKDILPRTRGFAERMIEEFMLLANEAAATLARGQALPFVYRVHENPTDEKLATLTEALRLLGINARGVQHGIRPKRMAEILESAKETPVYGIVNDQVLRSMAKAKYSTNPLGHYGLALENYAHFTSPIRRYPDLMIHRILSDFIQLKDEKAVTKRYRRLAHAAAEQSTATELRAVTLERSCEDCYKAEYMKQHIGERYNGIISGVTSNGVFVELPNTVEGMVRVDSLPGGVYEYDGYFELREKGGARKYRVGDPLFVTCTASDVNSGRIDFDLAAVSEPQSEDE